MKREFLVTAEEMKQYDSNTIEKIGLKACVLMERAAFAVAMETLELLKMKEHAKVLIFCGNGNNGADGVCAGRILKEYWTDCDVYLLKSSRPYGDELQKQIAIAQNYNVNFLHEEEIDLKNYDLIIDAIFGIGLNREITGEAKKRIEMINDSGIPVISVDIPSGIDATTGAVLGCAVKATVTVTFGFYKTGQLFYPGRIYCGELKKARIGIDRNGFFGMLPKMFTYLPSEQTEYEDAMRNPMGNKGTFGKVLVIAGRATTAGAAVLCASSALRSGCGMVAVFTAEENKMVFMTVLPEAMVETYTEKESTESMFKKLKRWIDWSDVIVMGCGLGRDETAYQIVKNTLQNTNNTVVCDADAIQLIAEKEDLAVELHNLKSRQNPDKHAIVFTPHPGELAALAHCSISDIKKNRTSVIESVLEHYPIILIAKDADTLVCCDGHDSYLNVTGNDGLSTAGSGDVLAGLTASVIAQGIRKNTDVFDCVCKSVYLHGKSADILAEKNGKSFLVASDLIEAYKYILK